MVTALDALRRVLPEQPEQEIAELAVIRDWCSRRIVEVAKVLAGGNGARLSPREIQIASLIAQYKTSKEIGKALGISYKTVDGFTVIMRRKLGVHHNAEIGAWFRREGQAA